MLLNINKLCLIWLFHANFFSRRKTPQGDFRAAGTKVLIDSARFAARMKSRRVTKPRFEEFSAAYGAVRFQSPGNLPKAVPPGFFIVQAC
jgi:hypothetical protein